MLPVLGLMPLPPVEPPTIPGIDTPDTPAGGGINPFDPIGSLVGTFVGRIVEWLGTMVLLSLGAALVVIGLMRIFGIRDLADVAGVAAGAATGGPAGAAAATL